MNVWIIAAAIPLGYFLIGVLLAMLAAYRAGRRNDTTFDSFDGTFWTFGWPILCVVYTAIFIDGKYQAFLMKIRDCGYQSTLPPENECAGRRVS